MFFFLKRKIDQVVKYFIRRKQVKLLKRIRKVLATHPAPKYEIKSHIVPIGDSDDSPDIQNIIGQFLPAGPDENMFVYVLPDEDPKQIKEDLKKDILDFPVSLSKFPKLPASLSHVEMVILIRQFFLLPENERKNLISHIFICCNVDTFNTFISTIQNVDPNVTKEIMPIV